MNSVQKYRLKPVAKEKYRLLNKRWYKENPTFAMGRNAKKRAKDLGVDFDLNWRDIVVPDLCPLLEIPLSYGVGKLHDNSPTIDRIKANGGYTKDNTWVVSFRANSIKRNSSIEEFEMLLENWKKKING